MPWLPWEFTLLDLLDNILHYIQQKSEIAWAEKDWDETISPGNGSEEDGLQSIKLLARF